MHLRRVPRLPRDAYKRLSPYYSCRRRQKLCTSPEADGRFSADQRRSRWRRLYARGERALAAFGGRGSAGVHRREQEGGIRHRMVSLSPLLPSSPGRDSLGRASKYEAPQGRLVLKEYTLDGSGAFRSGTPPPCTVWPRTVMRGELRKNKFRAARLHISCPTHGTEPP